MTKKNDEFSATVDKVFVGREDHGILTCNITLNFDSGAYQGFGNLCLNDQSLVDDFTKSLCCVFGVRTFDEIRGERCSALYAFEGWNEPIEGIEAANGKFILNSWRKKHFKDVPNLLEARIAREQDHIKSLQRRIDRAEKDLRLLKTRYTELE